MSKTFKKTIIGLPKTGKTTFLAALWHVLESNELEGSLSVAELPIEREYLNKLREEWLTLKEVERTKRGVEKFLALKLRIPGNDDVTEFIFPDLSGEVFDSQWEDRKWSRGYQQSIQEADGALLFVHTGGMSEHLRIDDSDTALEHVSRPVASVEREIRPWTIQESPSQVKMVDIVQFVQIARTEKKRLPLGIIVSAWDLVGTVFSEPEEWMKKQMPLFHQFLIANKAFLDYKIFGVSAIGGDLAKDLPSLRKSEPLDRIKVVYDRKQSNDITVPLKWLIEHA